MTSEHDDHTTDAPEPLSIHEILRRVMRAAGVSLRIDEQGRIKAAGNYDVDLEASTCTCPDHVHRLAPCKHLIAAAINYPGRATGQVA